MNVTTNSVEIDSCWRIVLLLVAGNSPGWTHRSLYQEVVLFELGALHLFAHPHRRHAPAGPLQRFVLFGLIFRLWLRAFAGSAVAGGDGLNRRRRLLRHVATELRQLAFEIGALLTDLPGQHALQVVDVCAELSDIHGRDRLGGAFLVLRARGTTAPLCLFGHGNLNDSRGPTYTFDI